MNQVHILKWFLLTGITESIGETAVNRFQNTISRFKAQTQSPLNQQPFFSQQTEKTSINSVETSYLKQAVDLAQSTRDLSELRNALMQFDGCSLKKTAAYTLDGMGVATNPTVLCLIDAPKAADEKVGALGNGDSGTLLLRMLKAIQLDCGINTYLAPVIPWRLPGDRKPTESEAALCLPFLRRRIELLNPRFILIFGAFPTKTLMDIESISKARQQTLVYETATGKTIPVVATFGPDMVSKGQSYRTNAWADLQKLQKMINKEEEEKNA